VSSVVPRRAWIDLLVFGAAALPRFALALWAYERIPPHADGVFYHSFARRLAEGAGYTWLWPDGVVTHAAHYPVGYPAFLAAGYVLFGPEPGVAMLLAALLQSVAAVATWRLLSAELGLRAGLVGGLGFALHPGLIAYTPALMTEGVTASLLALSVACTSAASRSPTPRARWAYRLALGMGLAAATYVRPQSLLFAPVFGALTASMGGQGELRVRRILRALGPALAVAAIVGALVAPWTLRNCRTMGRCALVSVNGGWNLAIGANQRAGGTWAELEVPPACREVYDEADKDLCFGREARRSILEAPGAWFALAPAKLASTFDYGGAGPWYLHAAAPEHVPETTKLHVAAVAFVFERLWLALGLAAVGRALVTRLREAPAWWGRAGLGFAVLGLIPAGWIGTMVLGVGALALGLLERGRASGGRSGVVTLTAASIILLTALVHVVFFGAGRYALPVAPAFVALASLVFADRRLGSPGEPAPHDPRSDEHASF
jgi:hypothetical protein